jgi:RNA polymerase sigma-70 factor, ECF subfamily
MPESSTTLAPPLEAQLEEHRVELTAYCYRMLGSVDAEDAVQETFIRAWRAYDSFEGRSALRSWLYRIATNVCFDMLESRKRRARPMDLGPAGEPIVENLRTPDQLWIEPMPDGRIIVDGDPADVVGARESVRLAFVAALQQLPPRQRAVLILCEVLRWKASEVAELLETTVASVNSALQRARRALDDRLPEASQQATLRSLGDERVREIVERFVDAFESGDVNAIVSLLAEDATFAMPPYPESYRGRDAIADSWLMPGGPPPRLRYLPTRANGQLALATYRLDASRTRFFPIALDVLTLRGARIQDVTAFRTPEVFPRFGLPTELAA